MTHAQPAPLRAGAAQVEITPPMGTQISGDIGRRRRDPEYDCEIQVFGLGDIAIVGLPGEPFVERQLRIKVQSLAYPTYVAHNCNDLLGCVPTPRAFRGGEYETRRANWFCLGPEALDMMADRTIAMLKDLF